MLHARDTKIVPIAFAEAIVDDASVTTASIDRKGWDHCRIYVYWGTTDIALTALKVQESNDDGSSDAYADVTGANFSGGTLIDGTTATLPGATDDDKVYIFDIDCRARERYLDLVATVGDGTSGGWLHAFAVLSRPKESPANAAAMGAAAVIAV